MMSEVTHYVGWDIGGAHIKVASINQSGAIDFIEQRALPLWENLEQLEEVIPLMLQQLPLAHVWHGITMTAEMVDTFSSRQEGVSHLLMICKRYLHKASVYTPEHGFLSLDKADQHLKQIASANWHASAAFTATKLNSGVLLDIGSTTTDIIPFHNNKVINRSYHDQDRMQCDELLYTGVVRTPLRAIASKVPFQGAWQTLAAEYFANTADVYRVLGQLQENDDLMRTADGRSKDVTSSIKRMARMLGTDADDVLPQDHWYQLAHYFSELQIQEITRAVMRVLSYMPSQEHTLVSAGMGHFLASNIATRLNLPQVTFTELLAHDQPHLHHQCHCGASALALAQLVRTNTIT